MPASGELLFGKIAVSRGFCTQAQIDECLRLQLQMQTPHQPSPKLGQLLVDRGFLTREQLDQVLALQKQNLDLVDPVVKKRKESVLFGRLVVREGLLPETDVNECLRLQAQPGESRSLGEIMVAQGKLSAEQVKELLGKQSKRIMSCPACRLSFTVLSLSEGKKVACPKCKGPLNESKPTESVRTDAEFATQMIRAVRTGMPLPKESTRRIPAAARKIKLVCVICDHVFEEPLDDTGRARCPGCHTTFTPRR